MLGVDYSMWSLLYRQRLKKSHICKKRHNFNRNAHVFIGPLMILISLLLLATDVLREAFHDSLVAIRSLGF